MQWTCTRPQGPFFIFSRSWSEAFQPKSSVTLRHLCFSSSCKDSLIQICYMQSMAKCLRAMFAQWELSGQKRFFASLIFFHRYVAQMVCHPNGWARPFISKLESSARAEKEVKDAQLAANVRQADLQQLVAKLDADFELLKSLKPDEGAEAQEHAKDMKYLRERQQWLTYHVFLLNHAPQCCLPRQGDKYVDEWMKANCCLIQTDATMEGVVTQFLGWKEQFRGEGDELLGYCEFCDIVFRFGWDIPRTIPSSCFNFFCFVIPSSGPISSLKVCAMRVGLHCLSCKCHLCGDGSEKLCCCAFHVFVYVGICSVSHMAKSDFRVSIGQTSTDVRQQLSESRFVHEKLCADLVYEAWLKRQRCQGPFAAGACNDPHAFRPSCVGFLQTHAWGDCGAVPSRPNPRLPGVWPRREQTRCVSEGRTDSWKFVRNLETKRCLR